VNIEDLPPLDLVLLSHFHGDHFDQVAERSLDKSLPIVTTPEAARELGKRGFRNTHALERWASAHISKGKYGVRVSAMPGRHGPAVVDLALPEVMGEMVEFLDEGQSVLLRIYITGDTLVFDDITEIPQRYPGIDLMLLHLGATRVMGVLLTMDAEQGVEMMRAVNPARAIPIHYDDYDVFTSPFSDFQKAVRDAGFEHRVHCMQRGDIYSFRVPESRRTPTTNGPGSSGVDGTGE
jgi:L-ascorbate metabolism protein UlaG (beta-lactamase superfamily)